MRHDLTLIISNVGFVKKTRLFCSIPMSLSELFSQYFFSDRLYVCKLFTFLLLRAVVSNSTKVGIKTPFSEDTFTGNVRENVVLSNSELYLKTQSPIISIIWTSL